MESHQVMFLFIAALGNEHKSLREVRLCKAGFFVLQGTWPELEGMPVRVVSGHRADWQGRDADIECYDWDPVTTVGYRVAFGDRSKADGVKLQSGSCSRTHLLPRYPH